MSLDQGVLSPNANKLNKRRASSFFRILTPSKSLEKREAEGDGDGNGEVDDSGAANGGGGSGGTHAGRSGAESPSRRNSKGYTNDEIPERALFALVKFLAEMARQQLFVCDFSPAATHRLLARFPKYICHLGVGIHFGTAIEGAIGSSLKIDASYVPSPSDCLILK